MNFFQTNSQIPFRADLKSLVAGDPVQQFIMTNYLYNFRGHSDFTIFHWQFVRIRQILKVIDVNDLKKMRILDVGGGFGHIGAFFAQLGAEVISIEGRRINCNMANIIHKDQDNFSSICLNVHQDESEIIKLGNFDFIICFGFFEVLHTIENLIGIFSKITKSVFCETIVVDSIDPNCTVKVDWSELSGDKDYDDRPVGDNKVATIFSPAYIQVVFEKFGFKHWNLFTKALNTQRHWYEWEHKNTGKVQMKPCLRRFWLFSK